MPSQGLIESLDLGIEQHMFDMAAQQQILGQIQHQKGAHAVIGKALPQLGGE